MRASAAAINGLLIAIFVSLYCMPASVQPGIDNGVRKNDGAYCLAIIGDAAFIPTVTGDIARMNGLMYISDDTRRYTLTALTQSSPSILLQIWHSTNVHYTHHPQPRRTR